VDQEYEDGGIVLGDEPGLGIRVDEDHIDEVRSARGPAAIVGPHVRPDRAGLFLVPEPILDHGGAGPGQRMRS
jgi:hypothetical protein